MPSFDFGKASANPGDAPRGSSQAQSTSALNHAGNQAVQRRLREEQEADLTAQNVVSSPPVVENDAETTNPPAAAPLSPSQRDYFESRFGATFGGVRIHTGPEAERSAAQLNARAYTLGSDIVFGSGEYQPGSYDGRLLLAHELTHIVQQSGSPDNQLRRQPRDKTCSADDQICTPIPENPLADYPFLAVALDRDSLQMLQDAAYRREHLRRGLPYDGPQGLFFAQASLSNFLAPGTEYVLRDELLSALLPGLFDAARTHADAEPFIAEIARNEAARQMLEPLGNPLVNVELPDPDGLVDTPSELTFTANFKKLRDDHGALALASLDPLSTRGAYLWTLIALNDARQLAEIAELNAKTEYLLEHYGERLDKMAADPADYTQDEVWTLWHEVLPDLKKTGDTLSSVLMPGNKDQTELVGKINANIQSLSTRSSQAMEAMNNFRKENMPDRTAGESWEENAEDIRKAASEDWEEGGWSYFAWFGNKIGLGANKFMHGLGNVASGGYMDTHAARAHAYRMGHISYNDYTGFHISDVVKGAIGDLAVALPFFGKGLGAGASTLLGLEEGTVAAGYVEGTVAGFSGGFSGAAATDLTSYLAANLSASEAERRFQAAQIGGPLSWIEAGGWGGVMGGPVGALSKLMPRPARAPAPAAAEGEAAAEVQPGEPEPQVSTAAETGTQLTTEELMPGATPPAPATGIKGYLQRSLLNKLVSSALEGSEPLYSMPRSTGAIGDQLMSVVEERSPMVSAPPGDLFTAPIDLANAPELPAAAAGSLESVPRNPIQLEIEVTEANPAEVAAVPAQPAAPDFGGVNPAPGTRTMTQEQWRAQDREQRIERRIDAIFAQLERGAGQQQVQQEAVQAPMAIDLQTAIRQALTNLRASGRRAAGNAAFGTMLHAELARVLRAMGFPAGAVPRVELQLQAFNTLSPTVLQRTVDQWFQNEGQAYQWLRASIPNSVLNSRVADIKPDFEISIGGNNIAFDLTSRERESHLAKTMLYAALLAREGQMTRVQEYYWVRWHWRGQ
ncbi:MAG TPA: DUF4157 domain-containing protein [Bryobacteraceae bacterium]|jgi:hypothetical protein